MENKVSFKKELGLFSSVSVLAGIIIGTGIFLSANNILQASNNNMVIALLVWFIGGLLTLFAGLCYAELGASLPQAGGTYVYLHKAFGPMIGFLSGMSSFIVSNPGSLAAISIGFAEFLSFFIKLGFWETKLLAVALIIILSTINYFGVKLGSIVQNLGLIGKLIPLVLIILVGLFVPVKNDIVATVAQPITAGGIASAIVLSLWAYEGWKNLNTVAEEIKNPQKNLPLAIIIALLLVIIVYVGYNFVMFKTLSIDQINSASNPAALVFETIFGKRLTIIVTIGILISMLGSLNGCILVFPRQYYAMAKDGLFFKGLAKLHPKYRTPHISIICSAIIGIIFVLIGNFATLTGMVVFVGWTFNALSIVAVFILRKKMPDLERPYKVIGFPIIPILVIISIIGILVSTLLDKALLSILGTALVFGLGIPLYFIFKKYNTKNTIKEN